ncbi:MAG: NAD-dependent epimerase/dehydratase family protein, partial [Candidatus Dadabacteria bacterium]
MVKDLPKEVKQFLKKDTYKWLVTGCAGFIGSHLAETLLALNQKVVGVDNFSTGSLENLEEIKRNVKKKWKNFTFIKGSLCKADLAKKALKNVDFILHQAALGSVPRSIKYPVKTLKNNLISLANLLEGAKDSKVKAIVWASSSSVYGNSKRGIKKEGKEGKPLSPYAASKVCCESWADAYFNLYKLPLVGLRYFNVFGPRQNPKGPYAAVIPRWLSLLLNKRACEIYGDGFTSRDFCYIENVVLANILAVFNISKCQGRVLNISGGREVNLKNLYQEIKKQVSYYLPEVKSFKPVYK